MTRAKQATSVLVTAYAGPVMFPQLDAGQPVLSETPVRSAEWWSNPPHQRSLWSLSFRSPLVSAQAWPVSSGRRRFPASYLTRSSYFCEE